MSAQIIQFSKQDVRAVLLAREEGRIQVTPEEIGNWTDEQLAEAIEIARSGEASS